MIGHPKVAPINFLSISCDFHFQYAFYLVLCTFTFRIFLFKKLFIFFLVMLDLCCCACFSLVVASGGYYSLRCMGFSWWRLLLLWSTGSRHTSFSRWGTWAQLLCDVWDLPQPGIEPISPALAGRFLSTVPPGNS